VAAAQSSRAKPDALAENHLAAHLFPGHPYARPVIGTLETLPRIDAARVRAFHGKHYRPKGALLAIAGDVEPERALALTQTHFGGWSGGDPPAPAPALAPAAGGVTLVDLPEAPRAEIRFGWLAPPRSDADAAALLVAQRALSGAETRFTALVTQGLLASGIRSALGHHRVAGSFVVAGEARPESAGAAVARMREELERFAGAPAADADLTRHARALRNQVPLQYETPGQVTGNWLLTRLQGASRDPSVEIAESLERLTPAEVAAATGRWLDPARAQIVVVGPAETIRPQLETLGQVTVVRADAPVVSAPPAVSAATDPPTEEQRARGRQTIERSTAAHGGSAKLRGIKDSTLEGEVVVINAGQELVGTLKQVRKEPYRMSYETNFFTNRMHQVLNGNRGWMRMQGTDARTPKRSSIARK
jgi:hypothetical protein